jgi:DNA-binding GntR family transcriptional regulator
MALVLTGFSLLASCAFFLSAEFVAINNSRLESTEYRVLQERTDAIRQEINHHERLLEKRLNSEFHRQWVEGEKNAERIRELKGSLIRLMELSSSAGKDTAMNEVPITRFFAVLGQIFGVSTEAVRNFGYGLLALLLEVITLGAISLANSMQYDVLAADKESDDSTSSESTIDDSEQRCRVVNLSNDIIRGQIQPVIRKIKAAQYELDIDEIRQVLMNLYLAGLIEKDARNSYKLIDISKS